MNTQTHRQLAGLIWQICNLLRGPYKRNEYRKVILPLTVLRRFDCLLAPTKAQALATFNELKGKPESIIRSKMDRPQQDLRSATKSRSTDTSTATSHRASCR